jgi:hypothetical protein
MNSDPKAAERPAPWWETYREPGWRRILLGIVWVALVVCGASYGAIVGVTVILASSLAYGMGAYDFGSAKAPST